MKQRVERGAAVRHVRLRRRNKCRHKRQWEWRAGVCCGASVSVHSGHERQRLRRVLVAASCSTRTRVCVPPAPEVFTLPTIRVLRLVQWHRTTRCSANRASARTACDTLRRMCESEVCARGSSSASAATRATTWSGAGRSVLGVGPSCVTEWDQASEPGGRGTDGSCAERTCAGAICWGSWRSGIRSPPAPRAVSMARSSVRLARAP